MSIFDEPASAAEQPDEPTAPGKPGEPMVIGPEQPGEPTPSPGQPGESTATDQPTSEQPASRFMSTTAGRVVVFAAVALISGVVGALVTRQGSSAQPAASITQTQGGPGFGGPNGGGGGFGRFGGGPRFGGGNDVAIAAQTIGVDQSQLLTALQSGQSIAQVASAHGVSAQKVIDAIVGARKATLADAVKAGRLTQAQADELVANLTQRVTQLVNDSGFAGGPAPGSAPGGSAGQPSTTTHTV